MSKNSNWVFDFYYYSKLNSNWILLLLLYLLLYHWILDTSLNWILPNVAGALLSTLFSLLWLLLAAVVHFSLTVSFCSSVYSTHWANASMASYALLGHLSYPLCLVNSCCLFCQLSPLLSSPLFCRWWNCLSPYIIWNMSWWSRTCEKLGIISSRPYITFSFLLCYDLMLQVHDQMMIDMFLRPLLLLLLIFYCCFIGLICFIDLIDLLYLLAYLKHTFLHLLEQSAK